MSAAGPRYIDLTQDLDVLFGTIDGEAENQSMDGWLAVGWSIKNRAALAHVHPHFGDGTIKGACLAHDQYDCWLPGADHDRVMAIDLNNLTQAQQAIMHIAQQIILGQTADPTLGATYYYARSIEAPFWVVGAWFCGLFGSQLFWKGIK